jgi:hypothetical protein
MKNRLKKAALLVIRKMTRRNRLMALYYWADLELLQLRMVQVMPNFYYVWLYHTCMWLAERRKFRELADVVIHRIPFHVRFDLAR